MRQMNKNVGALRSTREQALCLLEYADRTEQQLRQKLKEKDCPEDEIEETISFLKEYRYIDDAEYAKRYVRACSYRKSVRQIRADLEQKGIGREEVTRALQENPVEEEKQIQQLLKKRGYCPGERMEDTSYRKMMGALARKGFSYDIIHRVMDRMCEEA